MNDNWQHIGALLTAFGSFCVAIGGMLGLLWVRVFGSGKDRLTDNASAREVLASLLRESAQQAAQSAKDCDAREDELLRELRRAIERSAELSGQVVALTDRMAALEETCMSQAEQIRELEIKCQAQAVEIADLRAENQRLKESA